jgi:putative salt-induced outer membrane protein YdiY
MSLRSWLAKAWSLLGIALWFFASATAHAQATVATAPPVNATAYEYRAPPEKWEDQTVWKANIQAGLLWVSGNAESFGGSIAGKVSYRHKFDELELIFRAAYASSGVTDVTGGPITGHVTSAENWLARLRYDRYFDEDNAVYASFQASGDRLAGIAYRLEPQVGYSHKFVSDKTQTLRGEAGLDYRYDRYLANTVPIDDQFWSIRLYAYYENKFTPLATFSEGLEYLQAVNNPQPVLLNSVTSFSSTFATNYALKVSYILHYNSSPPPRPAPNPAGSTFGVYDGTLELVLAVTII